MCEMECRSKPFLNWRGRRVPLSSSLTRWTRWLDPATKSRGKFTSLRLSRLSPTFPASLPPLPPLSHLSRLSCLSRLSPTFPASPASLAFTDSPFLVYLFVYVFSLSLSLYIYMRACLYVHLHNFFSRSNHTDNFIYVLRVLVSNLSAMLISFYILRICAAKPQIGCSINFSFKWMV